MRQLGTIDLEILHLAVKENGTFDETHLEKSELKRLGVGKILDSLGSLKDRKFISLNSNGSFSITPVAKEILWGESIPVWAKVLRLLQIKSCNMEQITDILQMPEIEIQSEVEKLRQNQFVLMSPQRQDEKIIKVYEILPEGVEEIDKTETEDFDKIKFGEIKHEIEILSLIDEVTKDIQDSQIENKTEIIDKLSKLKTKLNV